MLADSVSGVSCPTTEFPRGFLGLCAFFHALPSLPVSPAWPGQPPTGIVRATPD